MLRKRAAHQKKVDSAVRVLQTTTGVNVPMAMILAGFSKSDIADEIVRQQVRRRLALMGGVTDRLVNVSPMKMGPEGHVSAQAYKNLCQAYSSLVPINQMNACAGDNSRKKLIPMLVKTFDIGTIEATGLLHRVVRDTAIDINACKLNCAEDRRIRWTTYQNLALWFDSWEAFLIEYGFAIISETGGGEDPETGLIVGSAFQRGFSRALNIKAWEKVGAVPLSRKCLSSPKVRRSIGDGDDDQQALVHLIVEHNTIACYALSLEGYNGDVMRVT